MMNINKRSNIRKRLNLHVDVFSFDEYLGLYRTRDIGLEGAFVDKCDRRLRPGDLIELHIHVQEGGPNPLRLRATVTRASDQGIGVVFDNGVEEYRKLLDAISAYTTDGHARAVPGFWYVNRSVH